MRLFLDSLEVENFKGIQHATFQFGNETSIFGANALGKTSIVDAYCWLLTNRDSRGNTPGSDKFREKPLDEFGQERHGLDTTVEARFLLDGQPLVLKRTQRENWVKKRGNAEATYQGNASTYWINSVETKSTDFQERINQIANGDVFNLITTLGAFNALDWKKRRAILIGMSGVDVDAELLKRDEFSSIRGELERLNIGVDDLKKVLADRKRDMAKELTLIPARIDEARHMRPQVSEQDVRDAEYIIKDSEEDLERVNAMIAQNGGSIDRADAQRKIIELEEKIVARKRVISDAYASEMKKLRDTYSDALKRLDTCKRTQSSVAMVEARNKAAIEEAARALEEMRVRYKAVYSEHYKGGETCQFCGQPIPANMVEEAKKRFNDDKAKRLAEINQFGKELKEKYTRAEEAERVSRDALDGADNDVESAKNAVDEAEYALNNRRSAPDIESDEEIVRLETELGAIYREKEESPDEQLKNLQKRKAELQENIDRAKAKLASVESCKVFDQRIKELEAKQTEIGQRRADTEVMMLDIERFITARCGLLEQSINEHFPTVRWKLFDIQINGAIVDCCECMIPAEGALVSYSGTNTAAGVNADIEIIRVLSEHYGIIAPVFVDNAERVNYIAKPAGQLIKLTVTHDKVLRIEKDANNKEVA